MVPFLSTSLLLIIAMAGVVSGQWHTYELASLVWWQGTSLGVLVAVSMCLRRYQHRIEGLVPALLVPMVLVCFGMASWAYGTALTHILSLPVAPWVALDSQAFTSVFACITLLQLLELQSYFRAEQQIYQAPWHQIARPVRRYLVPHLLVLVSLPTADTGLAAAFATSLWFIADLFSQARIAKLDDRLLACGNNLVVGDQPTITFGPWSLSRDTWEHLSEAKPFRFLTAIMPLFGAGAQARQIRKHVATRCHWADTPSTINV